MPEICTVNYIDHIGVAVKDINAALRFFQEHFGAPTAEIAELADQGVRATLIEVGQTRLELLEPLNESSAVGRFIQRRGEGLHHLAFSNFRDARARAQGLELLDKVPREGLSGSIAFIHPRSVFGILTELVESRP